MLVLNLHRRIVNQLNVALSGELHVLTSRVTWKTRITREGIAQHCIHLCIHVVIIHLVRHQSPLPLFGFLLPLTHDIALYSFTIFTFNSLRKTLNATKLLRSYENKFNRLRDRIAELILIHSLIRHFYIFWFLLC